MQTVLIASILVARVASGGTAAGLPQGNETPRATDLLRAKRMADEAAGRLEMRAPKRGAWVRGGGGWERSSAVPDRSSDRARQGALPSRRKVR
jgi:hypothetical protein